MDNYIKHVKPKKNGFYKQTIINPKQCKKYADSCRNEPIICRSGLELRFVQFFENTSTIKKWASEPIAIPYYSNLEKKQCNYYPDFIFENTKGDMVIVEVKPENQTVKPRPSDSIWLKQQWVKNVDKWTAAKKFAEIHNMKFIIATEKFFD